MSNPQNPTTPQPNANDQAQQDAAKDAAAKALKKVKDKNPKLTTSTMKVGSTELQFPTDKKAREEFLEAIASADLSCTVDKRGLLELLIDLLITICSFGFKGSASIERKNQVNVMTLMTADGNKIVISDPKINKVTEKSLDIALGEKLLSVGDLINAINKGEDQEIDFAQCDSDDKKNAVFVQKWLNVDGKGVPKGEGTLEDYTKRIIKAHDKVFETATAVVGQNPVTILDALSKSKPGLASLFPKANIAAVGEYMNLVMPNTVEEVIKAKGTNGFKKSDVDLSDLAKCSNLRVRAADFSVTEIDAELKDLDEVEKLADEKINVLENKIFKSCISFVKQYEDVKVKNKEFERKFATLVGIGDDTELNKAFPKDPSQVPAGAEKDAIVASEAELIKHAKELYNSMAKVDIVLPKLEKEMLSKNQKDEKTEQKTSIAGIMAEAKEDDAFILKVMGSRTKALKAGALFTPDLVKNTLKALNPAELDKMTAKDAVCLIELCNSIAEEVNVAASIPKTLRNASKTLTEEIKSALVEAREVVNINAVSKQGKTTVTNDELLAVFQSNIMADMKSSVIARKEVQEAVYQKAINKIPNNLITHLIREGSMGTREVVVSGPSLNEIGAFAKIADANPRCCIKGFSDTNLYIAVSGGINTYNNVIQNQEVLLPIGDAAQVKATAAAVKKICESLAPKFPNAEKDKLYEGFSKLILGNDGLKAASSVDDIENMISRSTNTHGVDADKCLAFPIGVVFMTVSQTTDKVNDIKGDASKDPEQLLSAIGVSVAAQELGNGSHSLTNTVTALVRGATKAEAVKQLVDTSGAVNPITGQQPGQNPGLAPGK